MSAVEQDLADQARCALCGDPIATGDDFEPDELDPFAAAVVCRIFNEGDMAFTGFPSGGFTEPEPF